MRKKFLKNQKKFPEFDIRKIPQRSKKNLSTTLKSFLRPIIETSNITDQFYWVQVFNHSSHGILSVTFLKCSHIAFELSITGDGDFEHLDTT